MKKAQITDGQESQNTQQNIQQQRYYGNFKFNTINGKETIEQATIDIQNIANILATRFVYYTKTGVISTKYKATFNNYIMALNNVLEQIKNDYTKEQQEQNIQPPVQEQMPMPNAGSGTDVPVETTTPAIASIKGLNKKAQAIINHVNGYKTEESKGMFAEIDKKLVEAGFKAPFKFEKLSAKLR